MVLVNFFHESLEKISAARMPFANMVARKRIPCLVVIFSTLQFLDLSSGEHKAVCEARKKDDDGQGLGIEKVGQLEHFSFPLCYGYLSRTHPSIP